MRSVQNYHHPYFIFFILILFLAFSVSANTFSATESLTISSNKTIISPSQIFELGFFNPASSSRWYLGIWYKIIPIRTYVWVANRDNPLSNSNGTLKISENNLVIFDQSDRPVWSTNITGGDVRSPVVAELLDNGNFLLRDSNNRLLWQSFDFPTDTLLQEMKLGWDHKNGFNRILRSWKNTEDPSSGDFSTKLETSTKSRYASKEEVTYSYRINKPNIYSILNLNSAGFLQRLTWMEAAQSWKQLWYTPKDLCDNYKVCGNYGYCDSNTIRNCNCIKGFKPMNEQEWDLRDGSAGCMRKTRLSCDGRDGFARLKRMKLPDTTATIVDRDIGLKVWDKRIKNEKMIGSSIGMSILLLISFIIFHFWKRKQKRSIAIQTPIVDQVRSQDSLMNEVVVSSRSYQSEENKTEYLDLPLIEWEALAMATNNFSKDNMLGQGGFGIVYKGMLLDGKEIAVKRLSKMSSQGTDEFMNEVRLIAKLQHINLVRLLGCCVDKGEKMLIYEFLENLSLDSHLFDKTRRSNLNWQKRFDIINGIARGLLYLHQDSRCRIIHRDLKASNVLLDKNMTPKISDFGMARIFGREETEANTRRVVGTYGYMSPEYAMDGIYSMKSDVFSFGVLLLEIISGKRNKGFYNSNRDLNLLGFVWRHWKEGKGLEIVDPINIDSSPSTLRTHEILRCIQIGLLCVQERAEDRPVMSSVMVLLGSETTAITQPKRPGFCIGRSPLEADSSSSTQRGDECTVNQITVSVIDAR
ncbi:unnamed protein product [Arabidopsis lyrata]|nr:unnamed protein product [Arabidopsis lyrata]